MILRLALAAACVLMAGSGFAATNELSEAQLEGRRLAQELREMRPETNSTITGVLKILRPKAPPLEIPVRFETVVSSNSWWTTYSTQGSNTVHAASASIVHRDDRSNEYRVALLLPVNRNTNNFIVPDETIIPFAGSDFWLIDLGLEFFHWPDQKLLKKEIKRGQSCSVLESVNPHPTANGYSRVVCWIDIDTGGIVQAEAYDAKGKLLKFFEPKGFKKVKGRWELEEIKIKNEQTGSRTWLEFQLDSK